MRPYMLLWLLANGNPHPLDGRPARRQAVEAGGAAEIAPDDAPAGCVPGPRRNLWPGLGYPSAVALERGAVYLDTDAGVLRDPHLAVRHADCAAYKVLVEGVQRGVVLENRLLRVHRQRRRWQGCHELQGGGEPYARAPHVRDDGGVPRLGDGRYLLAFGEPPGGAEVGLEDVEGTLGDPTPKARLPEQILPGSEVGVGEVSQGLVPL